MNVCSTLSCSTAWYSACLQCQLLWLSRHLCRPLHARDSQDLPMQQLCWSACQEAAAVHLGRMTPRHVTLIEKPQKWQLPADSVCSALMSLSLRLHRVKANAICMLTTMFSYRRTWLLHVLCQLNAVLCKIAESSSLMACFTLK